MTSLVGKVCLVTGATRGIGKGVALQLGDAGATVYITGRTLNRSGNRDWGSLTETAKVIRERGGTCIPVQCDHSQDEETKQLFTRIKTEQNGQLDILVNNAYSAVKDVASSIGKKFWEYEPDMWDKVNNVGLRNQYYCSVYAARMMVENKSGLIVNISSIAGLKYVFNVPYGVGKAAVDRMAVDCGTELKKQNVAFVSLWPGAVLTEIMKYLLDNGHMKGKPVEKLFEINSESTEFAGKCIRHLANDPNIIKKSARILLTGDLGDEYGLTDINGRRIDSTRQLNFVLSLKGVCKWLVPFIPNFVKLPYWMLTLTGGKF